MPENDLWPVGCLVMAAGNASRYGENKLAVSWRGKSLIERALDAVPAEKLAAVCVVTQYEEVEALARSRGFLCRRNDNPERGISHTIRLGTEALRGRCRAIVYLVADQPLLRRESVSALVDFYRAKPECIAALAHDGARGNPCVFPERFFPELCALTGDTGGGAVIRKHPAALRLLEADARELVDVDAPEALSILNR